MSNNAKFIFYPQSGNYELTTDQISHMKDLEKQLLEAVEFIRRQIKKTYYLP
jgi:hypothetical protein